MGAEESTDLRKIIGSVYIELSICREWEKRGCKVNSGPLSLCGPSLHPHPRE